MARFDVYTLPNTKIPYVLDVQADILSDLSTRVVVPLFLAESDQRESFHKRLKPSFLIEKKLYNMMTTEIVTVPKKTLGKKVANLEDKYRHTIIDALDFLLQGF
jgi:toxin CcdB